MRIMAYNAFRATHSGVLSDFSTAFQWARDNLPISPQRGAVSYEKELIADGRTMVMEKGGDEKCFAEDVVIFDAERFPPDEDGYIEW